ncbi:hypothetical protein D3C80_626450 [compost metagenome]
MQMHDVAGVILFAFFRLVLPAAGVGAGALVRIAFVDIAGQQAAAGVGHAQRTVDEDFQFHLRHLGADFGDLFQRQFTRQDHPRQAHLLPEFYRRPVYRICLHRQVDIHLREGFTHHHDQAGIGHDQRVRAHVDHGFKIAQEGFQLGIVRGDIHYHVEAFSQRMGFVNSLRQILVVEFIVTYPQAVTRLACINRVGAIGKGVTHVFQRAGWGEEFRCKHNESRSDFRSVYLCLSNRSVVGCIRSPQSLGLPSSRRLTNLPPSCCMKASGYNAPQMAQ